MITSIAHPTDFSPQGQLAFVHALRLAMLHRCPLDLLHVRDPDAGSHLGKFPKVRDLLQRWGALPAGAVPADVLPATGVSVRKVDIRDGDAVEGLAEYLWEHEIELVVMATHGRSGLGRWIGGSVSDAVMREAQVPALLLGPGAKGFVDPASGALSLRRALLPVAHEPAPGLAYGVLARVLTGTAAAIDCVHAGDSPPLVTDAAGAAQPVRQHSGDPIAAILAEAQDADLIAMPTAGRQGFMDALRGSTTERVIAQASCPVLALPVG